MATTLSANSRNELSRPATLACAELNSLRERKLAREINRVRLTAHVALPAIASALAAAAGIFLAAKCAANLGATRSGVHVCDPAIASRPR